MAAYTVVHTNYKNEETFVLIMDAESEKDAMNKSSEAKQKYLNDAERVELGQITAVFPGSEKWEVAHPLLCK